MNEDDWWTGNDWSPYLVTEVIYVMFYVVLVPAMYLVKCLWTQEKGTAFNGYVICL
jgi:hypothetical protein